MRGAADVSRRPADRIAAVPLDDEEGPKGQSCERCGRVCEPLELDTCPLCRKQFCNYCVYRAGIRTYCSRSCGDAFFFGGEDAAEEEG